MANKHIFVTYKLVKWPVCRKCGLIFLKNDPTRKRAKKPCPGTPDPNEG